MAIVTTPLGFKKPDGQELVRGGDNAIADNAQRAQELLASTLARLGQAEANIQAGLGDGVGLMEDPDNPGTYFMTSTSTFAEDPAYPGLYNF